MSKIIIKTDDLGDVITASLTVYHQSILDRINAAGLKAIGNLVRITKATAPKRLGYFRKSITFNAYREIGGDVTYKWGAKDPHYRLTHLLVHGHAGPNGSRVPGDPFLKNALDEVLAEYEKDVEEAVKE